MYNGHTVSLTRWDALEQLPMSCTDGQNIYGMLYVFWMHCTDCICSAVCYSEHFNTWPLIEAALLLRPGQLVFRNPGGVFCSHWS